MLLLYFDTRTKKIDVNATQELWNIKKYDASTMQ